MAQFSGQVVKWWYGFAVESNLEMQHDFARAGAAHFSDFLSANDSRALTHKELVIVSVGTQVTAIVFHDNKLSVSDQSTPAIDHSAGGTSHHGVATRTEDVDPTLADN